MQTGKSWWRTELPRLLLIIVGVLAFRSSLADHYYVPSGSMDNTLFSGDRVVVDKSAYGVRVPFTEFEITAGDRARRGEVVIFDAPRDGTRLIKRIAGVGGDSIALTKGRLSVNGIPVAIEAAEIEVFGDHQARLNLEDGGGPDIAGMLIPDGMLLALGDHRGNSLDGRHFGLVPESAVYGRALAVYRRSGEGLVWKPL